MGPAPVSLEKDLRTGMMSKLSGNTPSTDGAARFDGQAPLECLVIKRFQMVVIIRCYA